MDIKRKMQACRKKQRIIHYQLCAVMKHTFGRTVFEIFKAEYYYSFFL